MSELETVEFKIELDANWHDEPPSYEILIDDNFVEYGTVTEKQENGEEKVITFSDDLEEGEHVLKIRLLKKTDRQTLVDDDGKILKDQLLNIKQIEIDEIELDFLYYQLGQFHKQIGKEGDAPIFAPDPETEKYINLGWNGEYRLKFSVPTYMWFLENL